MDDKELRELISLRQENRELYEDRDRLMKRNAKLEEQINTAENKPERVPVCEV